MKKTIKAKIIKPCAADLFTDSTMSKTKATDPISNLKELRELRVHINRIQAMLEELLTQQGAFVKDMREVRERLFFDGLKHGMKNRKKLKKEFEAKTDRLLEKCGVKKKPVLSADDIERIRSRYDL